MIDKAIRNMMEKYPSAREETFKNHPIAHYIRHEVPEIFKNHFPQEPDLLWIASPGQGQWSDAPWITVFNPLVTESVQEGY